MSGEGLDFVRLEEAVLIHVAPDLELAEQRIAGIKHAILVAVECAERLKIGVGTVDKRGERPFIMLPQSVSIDVIDQKAIVGRDPGTVLVAAVTVFIHENGSVQRAVFDAVAVEIKRDRRAKIFPTFFGGIRIVRNDGRENVPASVPSRYSRTLAAPAAAVPSAAVP